MSDLAEPQARAGPAAGAEADAGPAVADPGTGTAEQLLAFQRLAWTSLVISVTRRCPLTCSHCITRSGPDVADPLLPPETARRWAAELPALAARGLEHLTFTGGEPVLALDSLALLSEAAAAAGIRNYVVTSGTWGSSDRAAERVVARLPRVDHWDLGYDAFHAETMPRERLARALAALERAGAAYTLRVCRGPDTTANRALLAELAALVGPNGRLMTQPTRALGRAADGDTATDGTGGSGGGALPQRPCVSTGLFLRADGSSGPCCSGLAYEARGRHPFDYGHAEAEGGLLEAWRRWHADPLLRLLRLAGFGALQGWLAEEGLLDGEERFSEDPCEACVALWQAKPAAARRLAARARQPEVQAKLDLLEEALYGDVWTHPDR